jgi:choline dehydrogenase-like flavoprotein
MPVSADPFAAPRATNGRAPDVFQPGGWVPMQQYDDNETVDFVVVGTGAGGGPLIAGLAEGGLSVIGLDAGPYFRPLEDFASDETEQNKLYWTDTRVVGGANPIVMGGKNSGKAVGGSTVHFAMVSLRFRPEWFKSRSLLGYGADWPLDWREMWDYYAKAERALSISGPVTYPWGPKRPRYPYRAHELNGPAELLARGAEALGYEWSATPLATVSAPRGKSPPCVYRGFCRFGCSTNAKQSQLVTFIPRALAAGAEIRDLAMVGRIEVNNSGRATGVHYHREGRWRFQRARNVVVAGYAIETPRLLLASATDRFSAGLANSSGLVGKNLMTQSNQAVFGTMKQEVRWNRGPPSLAITEHWNYDDRKDFFGGYCWMAQGPLPIEWVTVQTVSRGIWGQALVDEMKKYNHQVGLKIVGEMLPDERNTVTLADEIDQYGLRVARVTYRWGDNDKALIQHALDQMQMSLEAVGACDIFRQENDTNHLAGTARMGDDPETSVINADCRTWDIPNLWICDGSVFPTTGGVNPSLTITAIGMRTADRIKSLAARGELEVGGRRRRAAQVVTES